MAQQANHPLPGGHMLEEYLATDPNGKQVAIKEYIPNSLSLRGKGETKPVISADHLGAFRYGMKCFFEEGRALARMSHPNVIRVLNFFRANETVYLVMEYEHGGTLQEYIQKHQGHISERFMRGVFTRMLNGLREVHSHKLLHLDMKPSNIYLRTDNTPVLIDFGAARQTLASDQPMLKPMYTPGFASPEHYNTRKDLGPWSDIYSVGASMYACLAGCAPQAADERLRKDVLAPAMMRWDGQYSDRMLEIIDWCLNLNHLYRPQSVFALQKALVETVTPPAPKANSHWLGRFVEKMRKPI
jgi:serine/threonine protein kinase